jgi:hypothetical protein
MDALELARVAGTECLQAALSYLQLGWSVLGLCPPDHYGVGKQHAHSCDHPGKRPWPQQGKWKEFQERLPTEAEVRSWWQEHPFLNVGCALGPVSGLIRVDVEGEAGQRALEELSGGAVPDTVAFRSGRRDGTGKGLLYAIPSGAPLRTTVYQAGAKTELRFQAGGAQTVLPPSRHPDGGRYEWLPGCSPFERRATLAPPWLVHALSAERSPPQHRATASSNGETIPEGKRDDTLTSMAGTMRRKGFDGAAILAALLITNEQHCDPPLPEAQVQKIAVSVCRYAPELRVVSGDPEEEEEAPSDWPEKPGSEAYDGLAGEIVQVIRPETEADPVAILVQILVMFGSDIGRTACWQVEDTRHHGNLFCCLVGDTSTSRKGTSRCRAMQAFSALGGEPSWHSCLASGLSTGEGLIAAVRDPTYKVHHVKQRGRVVDTQNVLDDPGVVDKRLLVVESEFGRSLRAMQREGNTLSPVLRLAWDGDSLSVLTRGNAASRLRATDPHVSLIAHITPGELHGLFADLDIINGLANRLLWVACRYSKLLPLGGRPIDLGDRTQKVARAVEQARQHPALIPLDAEAARLWDQEAYAHLFHRPPGLLGAVTNRAVAQVRRLGLLYALLDFDTAVRLRHLKSALALWGYCERSARWLFGDSTGNRLADEILAELRGQARNGLTRTQIRDLFSRHAATLEINRALAVLRDGKLARTTFVQTEGRPMEKWFATPCDKSDKSDKSCAATTYGEFAATDNATKGGCD